MDRIGKDRYEVMPWSCDKSKFFTKPEFNEIKRLKAVALWDRNYLYSEFYELQAFLDLTDNLAPGVMLDLGSGCGNLSYLFSFTGWKIFSCDADAENFIPSKKNFTKSQLNQDFPFRDNAFDCIVSKQVIEHLDCPVHLIREVKRILRPNGKFIFSTPNISALNSRLKFLQSGYLLNFERYWRDHRSIVHYDQLKYILEENNFKEIEFHTNRYELYNLNPVSSGKRKRFLVPFLKFITLNDLVPVNCKFGNLLIISATLKK